MAYKKLKSFVAPVVQEDGSLVRNRRYQPSATIDIFIETTGKLRLFIKVPQFIDDALQSFTATGGVELGVVEEKKGGGKFSALLGRDPDALERSWRELIKHYQQTMDETKVEPVIRIRKTPSTSGRYHGTNSPEFARIEIEFERYLRNTSTKPQIGFRSSISDYAWNDLLQPKVARNRNYDEKDWTVVPYDQQLWDQLTRMRDQIQSAQKRYQEMVESGEIVKRLLTGSGLALLGGPKP